MQNATVIADPGRPEIRAVFLRAHLRMRLAGMMSTARTTNRSLLASSGKITGKSYKNSKLGISNAIADLTAIIEAGKA